MEFSLSLPNDLNREELILNTIRQINKDFGDEVLTEGHYAVSTDVGWQIRDGVEDALIKYIESSPAGLKGMLYRFDLDEAAVESIFRKAQLGDTPRLLAELMIERAFQKVVRRLRYRG